ncbi:MAG: DUF5131 family protein [Erysipelotrichaceae bacterium]
MDVIWNPWHGCHKISEGCAHCYMFRHDLSYGRNPEEVHVTQNFDLPLRKKRDGSYRIEPGSEVFVCMTSDFFIEEGDAWRNEVWQLIRQRPDVRFTIITKRIHRFAQCIPTDWGNGYPHVRIGVTMENQHQYDLRYPLLQQALIATKFCVHEPLLSPIVIAARKEDDIAFAVVGGESGPQARECDFDWVLHLAKQYQAQSIPFVYKQTGARLRKDGKLYRIPRAKQHSQARKAMLTTL